MIAYVAEIGSEHAELCKAMKERLVIEPPGFYHMIYVKCI